ncbi:MAG: glycosyltransferase [bacterium]
MSKNILIIPGSSLVNFGGTEKVTLDLIDYLSKYNLKISIFTVLYKFNFFQKNKDIIPEFRKYQIYRVIVNSFFIPRFFYIFLSIFYYVDWLINYKILLKYLSRYNFDIIIISNLYILPSLIKAVKIFESKPKIFFWDHGTLVYFYYRKNRNIIYNLSFRYFLTKIFNYTDNYLCISRGIERIIKEINPEANTYLVYNPVEIPKEVKLIPRGENNVLLYVGRLEDNQKNISFMLRGLSRLKEYKWELRVIGKGPDEGKLRKLSKELGIEERIRWEGFKRDPYEDLEEVKVLLLTSRWEGLPLVLVEGNVRGIPFLSSNCVSGPEDIVIEGVNGYLYEEGNMEDFVDKLRRILTNELRFAEPYEVHKTSYRFEKSKILNSITNIILG